MECVPLYEALSREWPSDAHVTTYAPTGQTKWPRLNKSVLEPFRALGGDVLATCMMFDWDTPGHVDLDGDRYEAMVEQLANAADAGLWLAGCFYAAYTTRGGMRLVYVLERPVPVDEAEGWVRAVVRDFAQHGIALDPSCADWTRLFRLPRVLRDGQRTSQHPLFECVVQEGARLDVDRLVRVEARKTTSVDAPALDLPMPDPSASRDLLRERSDKTGNLVMTPWLREARKRLRGRSCYACAFEGAEVAPQGERHHAIMRYVGEACAALHRLDGTTPELVFAVFVDAMLRIDPQTCRDDPFETLWEAVLYCWAREQERKRVEDEDQRTREEGRESVRAKMLEGVRTWCDHSSLTGTDDEAGDWLDEHLVACHGRSFHVMRRDGFYDSLPVSAGLVPARVRELGMDSMVDLVEEDPTTGRLREVSPQTLLNRCGTIVRAAEGVIGPGGSTIRDVGTDRATFLMHMFARRTDLEPEYDAEVDEWLNTLAGDENYYDLLRWIGHALDFEGGPICALSIEGPPGVGKGLLMQGLAETVDTQTFADTKELGNFQSQMVRTPFLLINEGLPTKMPGTKDVADTFRALVDGSATVVNQKHQSPIVVHNPMRVVVAANNEDVVSLLAGDKDLSPHDQEALAMRLFHLEVDEGAAEYLRVKGGFLHTARPGRRWVRGHAGEASAHVVAKHFLHLHATRPEVRRGSRFLMEGPRDSRLVRRLSTRSGNAPEVVETVIHMIESNKQDQDAIVVQDGSIYVTTGGVVNHHRNAFASKSRRSLSSRAVSRTLDSLRTAGSPTEPYSIKIGDKPVRKRWRELDSRRLLGEAVEYGYRCERLRRIVEAGAAGTHVRVGDEARFRLPNRRDG